MEELKKKLPETIEITEAIFAVIFLAVKHFKDGVQASDFAEIVIEAFKDESFHAKVRVAINNGWKAPAEFMTILKEKDFLTIWELVKYIKFNLGNLFGGTAVKTFLHLLSK